MLRSVWATAGVYGCACVAVTCYIPNPRLALMAAHVLLWYATYSIHCLFVSAPTKGLETKLADVGMYIYEACLYLAWVTMYPKLCWWAVAVQCSHKCHGWRRTMQHPTICVGLFGRPDVALQMPRWHCLGAFLTKSASDAVPWLCPDRSKPFESRALHIAKPVQCARF